MNNQSFYVERTDGERLRCDILFTYESHTNGKNYIIYTDNSTDETGSVNVYASIFDPSQENPSLDPIETEAEWNMIETILTTLQRNAQAEERGETRTMEQIQADLEKALRGQGLE